MSKDSRKDGRSSVQRMEGHAVTHTIRLHEVWSAFQNPTNNCRSECGVWLHVQADVRPGQDAQRNTWHWQDKGNDTDGWSPIQKMSKLSGALPGICNSLIHVSDA